VRAVVLGAILLTGCVSLGLRPGLGDVWLLSCEQGAGSCFPVASVRTAEGWDVTFMTARHVVDRETIWEIEGFTCGEVLALHPKRDIALIRFRSEKRIQPYRLAQEEPRRGERIFVAGCPQIHDTFLKDGFVCGPGRMSAPIYAGESGGPVFRQNGEVIGVAVSRRISFFSPWLPPLPQSHLSYFAPTLGLEAWILEAIHQ